MEAVLDGGGGGSGGKGEMLDAPSLPSASGAAAPGSNNTIEVYARIRPAKDKGAGRALIDVDLDKSEIEVTLPHSEAGGVVNNTRENFNFRFNGILGEQATQEEVFDKIARNLVLTVMQGYNGTIFAYGQTGSGKTFTITGGPERYEDRGLIPRTLAMLFQEIEKRRDMQFEVRISYLEIYNDCGYDLLDPKHESKKLEDLPKVQTHTDDAGNVRLSNLGELPTKSVEEALNLLFVGDTNRVICETPSNDSSTRSHCIFTINLEAKMTGGTKIRRSKLHLVDLAGSERVKKTGIGGKIFTEAKFINLSLHYLEQVIVALHEKSQGKRTHVPYRNSMMTSVLRDSLGGNCKTVMIATLSPDRDHLDESVSTCRFAQRVALIKNEAHINEEDDPKLVIRMLKARVRELTEENTALKGQQPPLQPLSEEEQARCRQAVQEFLQFHPGASDEASDATASVLREELARSGLPLSAPHRAMYCFLLVRRMLRSGALAALPGLREVFASASSNSHASSSSSPPSSKLAWDGGGGSSAVQKLILPSSASGGSSSSSSATSASTELQDEVKKLRSLLQHRDHEIGILVNMLKQQEQEQAQGKSSGGGGGGAGRTIREASGAPSRPGTMSADGSGNPTSPAAGIRPSQQQQPVWQCGVKEERGREKAPFGSPPLLSIPLWLLMLCLIPCV